MNNFTTFELSMIDKGWKSTHKSKKMDKDEVKEIRICAYLRKSQEDIKDNSLKLQLDEINKFIKSINLLHKDEFKFYYEEEDIYQEDNVSGMQGRARPEFDKMLNNIEENPGYYGVCLVYKLDRFSRKLEDTLSFISLLSKNNCVLKALDFEDNGDPSSALLRGMLGIVAQYHAQNSAVTSIKGTVKKVEENKAVGLLPLGLMQEKILNCDTNFKGASRIVIDESKAPIIREIFQKYADGIGITEIVDYLAEKGYTNNMGKPITRQNVKYILTNKRYNGTYVYADPSKTRKRKYDNGVRKPDYYEKPNAIPKIIDDELWNKVQLIVNSKFNCHQFSSNYSANYLLTDFLVCGCCGNTMHGWSRTRKNKNKYYDYVCTTHKKDINECPTKRINRNYVDKVVIKLILQILNDIAFEIQDNFDSLIKKRLKSLYNEISLVKKEIKNRNDKISRLVDRILTDDGRTQLYENKIKEQEREIYVLNNKLSKLEETECHAKEQLNSIKENLVINEEMLLNNISFAKVIISLIIDKILISNEKIEIKLKVKKQE